MTTPKPVRECNHRECRGGDEMCQHIWHMYRDYRGLDVRLEPILQVHMDWARSTGELERKVTALRWLAWAATDWLRVRRVGDTRHDDAG